MRYNAESQRITVDAREFISIARRCISGALPYDANEPTMRDASVSLLKKILPTPSPCELIYSYTEGEYLFDVIAHAEKAEGGEIWVAKEIESNPKKPRREEQSQARGEAYIAALAYAKANGISKVAINVVYVNPNIEGAETKREAVKVEKLVEFFVKCLSSVSKYARPEVERVTERLPSMKSLKFPHRSVREGQSEFVRAAYKTIARGGTLFATAPTGTGKTVSALYPAIRTLGDGRREKIFYLTPKETTAEAAADCLADMARAGAIIRAVILTAKEKCCECGSVCKRGHGLCKRAECNDLPDATLALYNEALTVVSKDKIREIATKHNVCPYELSLTYAELCDVVICDFNYLFDPSVYIRRFFTYGGNYAILVDEAHNLPDRAREMYSAEISLSEILGFGENELVGEHSPLRCAAKDAARGFEETFFPLVKENVYKNDDGIATGSAHTKEIPYEAYGLIEPLLSALENEILHAFSAKDEQKDARLSHLRASRYTLSKFYRAMQAFDTAYEVFIFYTGGDIRVKLFCIDPSREIAKRTSLCSGAVFFSATLSPAYYYKSVLGADGTADMLSVDSPFSPEQLEVAIVDSISTRYSEREKTIPAVCRAIAATVSAKRGNYIVFSPSFEYSEALADAFARKYPKIRVLRQRKNMSQKEKADFLLEFKKESSSYLIGFCVMGGIYAEGIDLAGDSLIGAVVVGIGMPGLSYEREAISAYYDDKYEEGKQFAYIYPGMNRVLQAAGRVIRREDDRGVIVLIDDRFDDPIYKKIIPTLWRGMKFYKDPVKLRESLDKFWAEASLGE